MSFLVSKAKKLIAISTNKANQLMLKDPKRNFWHGLENIKGH